MKKFWNLMLAALVVLGAVACSENGDELTPQVEREGLSFEATIIMDDTRTSLEKGENGKWNTVWSGDETLVVTGGTKSYDFVYRADKGGKFSCNAEGVESLIGQPIEVRLKHSASTTIDSKAGMAGGSLYASVAAFDPATGVELETENSFFRFSSFTNVTLTASENIFVCDGVETNTITLAANNNAWVAFNPAGEVALSCEVNGVENFKSTTKTFVAKKVYNLGNMLGDKNEDFGIVGAHQGWNTENLDAMYLIPGSNTYVCRNVKLASGGFKIYGTTTKTVTIEHPEVTGGEPGYLFLKPNSNWTQANARFAAYFFGNGEEWISMTDSNKDGIYAVEQPKKTYPNVIFCRMNPSNTTNGWNNKWNQTGDLVIPTDGKNLFTVPSGAWDGSTSSWSVHTVVEHQDAWTEVTEETTTYWFGKDNSDNISNWVTRWSNNGGGGDIEVSNLNTTYDIYFHKGDDQDWGFEVHYIVLEHGSKTPTLK